jgi:hypothetical protein
LHPGHVGGLALSRVRDTTLFLGGLAVAAVLHLIDPSEATFPTCPFYAVTGLYCPGCGTLRCLHALLHADLRSALDYNALTVVFVPMVVLAWLSVGVAAIRGREPPQAWNAPRWAGSAFGVTFGLFWLVRNLPLAPFSWMAP